MLANELGRRRIATLVIDEKPGTAVNPQANATQARTMEHFRRLGFADEVRALGLPSDFPTDVAYFTRYARHELARFHLPSAREATARARTGTGSWSAAELPHRVSQKFVEQILRRHAEALPGVSVHYGCRMIGFADQGDRVALEVERVADGARQVVFADYLVGADGPRSAVRQALGVRYTGEAGAVRDFMGGRMYAVYLRAPGFYRTVPHPPAWMNVTFNRDRRALMAAVDGQGEFAFHTQLRPHEREDQITDADALHLFEAATGAPIAAEILSRCSWTAGHALVAERFHRGRVFLGGDAAHLFTPTGGLGYNTAVEDAVNLGWKLAAVTTGRASPHLLDTYDAERRPLAVRNTGYARQFADSLGRFAAVAEIEDDGPAGDAARRHAGAYLEAHGRAEFDIPGITFGGRYDGSAAIVADGTAPPPDAANVYVPSACPGGRPPHLWLADGRSIYDTFGIDWTLLRLGPTPPGAEAFVASAQRRGLALAEVHLASEEARDLYAADLALIRPDQIVCWRGADAGAAEAVLAAVTGAYDAP
jgi:2-polyprenyl-6-methoxyphenol hydroxylase-like FAD-dependent oxidoreductase